MDNKNNNLTPITVRDLRLIAQKVVSQLAKHNGTAESWRNILIKLQKALKLDWLSTKVLSRIILMSDNFSPQEMSNILQQQNISTTADAKAVSEIFIKKFPSATKILGTALPSDFKESIAKELAIIFN